MARYGKKFTRALGIIISELTAPPKPKKRRTLKQIRATKRNFKLMRAAQKAKADAKKAKEKQDKKKYGTSRQRKKASAKRK